MKVFKEIQGRPPSSHRTAIHTSIVKCNNTKFLVTQKVLIPSLLFTNQTKRVEPGRVGSSQTDVDLFPKLT